MRDEPLRPAATAARSTPVTLPTGEQIRIDTSAGVQSVYLSNEQVPLFQSAWTVKGPVVTRARQRMAFLLDDPFDPEGILVEPRRRPGIGPDVTPEPLPSELLVGGVGLAAAALAVLALYAAQQIAPASQGVGEGDKPVLSLKAWTVGANTQPIPVMVDSVMEEQLRASCRFLPDVQNWTDDAAALLAEQKPLLPART